MKPRFWTLLYGKYGPLPLLIWTPISFPNILPAKLLSSRSHKLRNTSDCKQLSNQPITDGRWWFQRCQNYWKNHLKHVKCSGLIHPPICSIPPALPPPHGTSMESLFTIQIIVTLLYSTLYWAKLHFTAFHCTTLHYTTLHCTTLHYTALGHLALHYTSTTYWENL